MASILRCLWNSIRTLSKTLQLLAVRSLVHCTTRTRIILTSQMTVLQYMAELIADQSFHIKKWLCMLPQLRLFSVLCWAKTTVFRPNHLCSHLRRNILTTVHPLLDSTWLSTPSLQLMDFGNNRHITNEPHRQPLLCISLRQ